MQLATHQCSQKETNTQRTIEKLWTVRNIDIFRYVALIQHILKRSQHNKEYAREGRVCQIGRRGR